MGLECAFSNALVGETFEVMMFADWNFFNETKHYVHDGFGLNFTVPANSTLVATVKVWEFNKEGTIDEQAAAGGSLKHRDEVPEEEREPKRPFVDFLGEGSFDPMNHPRPDKDMREEYKRIRLESEKEYEK